MLHIRGRAFWVLAVSLLIAACGGGGDGNVELTPQSAMTRSDAQTAFGVNLSDWGGAGGADGDGGVGGAAGDGAPLKRAVIVITDANGKSASGLTDDNGNYVVTFTGFTRPLVGKVVDAGGNVLASVSVEPVDTGKFVRMNINPLTDRILSQVLGTTTLVVTTPSGTSTVVVPVGGTDKTYTGASVNTAGLDAAKKEVLDSVKAALKTAGVNDDSLAVFDPVRSAYQYDGKGVDAVIESISHSRDPVTGATQLAAKLAPLTNNPDGSAAPTLITSSTPLATTQVALSTNPTLTFDKLNAWAAAVNYCLAGAAPNDPKCAPSRFHSADYKNSSRDFDEDFVTLLSNSDRSGVVGSTVRNPVVLFISRSEGSSIDDRAVVEVTIRQPGTGPLAGNITTSMEYTKTIVFKRDDSLVDAAAGNWTAHGNQRNFNDSVTTRYRKSVQVNGARAANDASGVPSSYQTRLNLIFSNKVFDTKSRTYIDSNVRAVRVTGPGLPAAGVVLTRTSVIGSGSLGIFNKTGTVPTSLVTTNTSSNSLGLAAIALDGSPLVGTRAFNPASSDNSSTPPDFSKLAAFARYKWEIFLNSNLSTTPDSIEYIPNLAPVHEPSSMLAMALNDPSPSLPFVTAPAPAAASILVQWQNNLNAAPVNSAQVYAEERNPKGATSNYSVTAWDSNLSVFAAYSLNNRPTSYLVSSASSTPFPSLAVPAQAGDFRQIAIWSSQGRASIQNLLRWDN